MTLEPGITSSHESARPAGGFASSVKWLASTRWIAQLLSWITTVFVARLVSPDSYGIIGMSVVILSFSNLLTDFGISTTIITRQEVDDDLARQLHTISILMGAIITCSVLAAATPAVLFFGETRLRGVLALLSGTFLLSGATNVPVAWLQKHLRYRTISLIELARSLTISLTTLIVATRGGEYWALALGSLAGAFVFSLLVTVVAPMRPRKPDLLRLRPTLHHTHNFFFSAVAWFGYSNADSLVLGRMAGTELLGQYRFASSLASMPNEKLVNVLTNVTLPVIGAIQNRQSEVRTLFLDLTELVALVVFPLLATLAAISETAVPIVFGSKWNEAVPIIQIMCITACLQSLQAVNGQVLRARGLSREARVLGVLALILMPVLFLLGAHWGGGFGVACAWVVGQPVLFGYPFTILRRDIALPARKYWERLVPGMAIGLLSGLAALAGGHYSGNFGADIRLRLLCQCMAAAACVGCCAIFYRKRGTILYNALIRH